MSTEVKTPEQETPQPALSGKRRSALVIYLAILFIVALAVVTLSLVIQIHNNTEQYQTIAERAYSLQEENTQLARQQESQAAEILALQEDVETLRTDAEEKQTELDRLSGENDALRSEADTLKEDIEKTQLAYSLLAKAKDAYEKEDAGTLLSVMDELTPLKDWLGVEAKTEFNALLTALDETESQPAG